MYMGASINTAENTELVRPLQINYCFPLHAYEYDRGGGGYYYLLSYYYFSRKQDRK